MTGKQFTIKRELSSKRFTPKKTHAQRAFDFLEQQRKLSEVPLLDVEYSVKAAQLRAGAQAGAVRNAAADNKQPKKKAQSKYTKIGILVYDPEEKWSPGKVFSPIPRFRRPGGSDENSPNWGWVTPLRTTKPREGEALIRRYIAQNKRKRGFSFDDGVRDARTGGIKQKALGPNLATIRRGVGGLANIARAITRGVGLLEDAAGRLRCPPGVPAAMQFTDDMGSNCFDINPVEMIRSIARMVTSRNEIATRVHEIQHALRSAPVARQSDISPRPDVPVDRLQQLKSILPSPRLIRNGKIEGKDGQYNDIYVEAYDVDVSTSAGVELAVELIELGQYVNLTNTDVNRTSQVFQTIHKKFKAPADRKDAADKDIIKFLEGILSDEEFDDFEYFTKKNFGVDENWIKHPAVQAHIESNPESRTKIDELELERNKAAKAKKEFGYDPCQILSEQASNLFCAENEGYARIKMPQASGKVHETYAPDDKGSVEETFAKKQLIADVDKAIDKARKKVEGLEAKLKEATDGETRQKINMQLRRAKTELRNKQKSRDKDITEGEANLQAQLEEHIKGAGFTISEVEQVDASTLYATQRDMDGANVHQMYRAYREWEAWGNRARDLKDADGKRRFTDEQIETKDPAVVDALGEERPGFNPGASEILISEDGRIVDGHHRYLTVLLIDMEDGKTGDHPMPVKRINTDISTIRLISNDFMAKAGIKAKPAKKGDPAPEIKVSAAQALDGGKIKPYVYEVAPRNADEAGDRFDPYTGLPISYAERQTVAIQRGGRAGELHHTLVDPLAPMPGDEEIHAILYARKASRPAPKFSERQQRRADELTASGAPLSGLRSAARPQSTTPMTREESIAEYEAMIGPVPSLPITEADIAALMTQDDVRALIKKSMPELDERQVDKMVERAMTMMRVRNNINKKVEDAFAMVAEMGFNVDRTNAQSVMTGLMDAFSQLRERGDVRFEIRDIFSFLDLEFDKLSNEELTQAAFEKIAQLIFEHRTQNLGRLLPEAEISKLTQLLQAAGVTDVGKFIRDNQNTLIKFMLGQLDIRDMDAALIPLARNLRHAMIEFQTHQAGSLMALLVKHKEQPGSLYSLTKIKILNPFNPDGTMNREFRTVNAEVNVDDDSDLDMAVKLTLNPMGKILDETLPKIPRGEFRLFTSTDGLIGEQLEEIRMATDADSKRQLADQFLRPFDAVEGAFTPGSQDFMADVVRDHLGTLAKDIFVIEHEMTHVRQIELAYRALGLDVNGERIRGYTNKELAILVARSMQGSHSYFDASYVFKNPAHLSKLAALGVDMEVFSTSGITGAYPTGHLQRSLEIQNILELRDPALRTLYVQGLVEEIKLLSSRQGNLSMSEENRLNVLSDLFKRDLEVRDDGSAKQSILNMSDTAAILDRFREQNSIFFLEASAEINAGRKIGLIPETPEVREALAYLDLDEQELKTRHEIKKRKESILERIIESIAESIPEGPTNAEIARQRQQETARLIQERINELARSPRGRRRGTAAGTTERLPTGGSRMQRGMAANAWTKADVDSYMQDANARIFGTKSGRGESRAYYRPVRQFIADTIKKQRLEDFSPQDFDTLRDYLINVQSPSDKAILDMYPGWELSYGWERIREQLRAQNAIERLEELQAARNRYRQNSFVLTILQDFQDLLEYRKTAPDTRNPQVDAAGDNGKPWRLPAIRSASNAPLLQSASSSIPRRRIATQGADALRSRAESLASESSGDAGTLTALRSTSRRFDTRESINKYGSRQRARVMENTFADERRVLESQLPEKIIARVPATDIAIETELRVSAKRRRNGKETFENRISRNIVPLLESLDKSEIDSDIVVSLAMAPRAHSAIRTGDTVSLRSISRSRVMDENSMTSRPNTTSRRMLVRIPAGSRGIFDYDQIRRPAKEKGDISSIILPPGSFKVIDRLRDGTIVAELSNQKNAETVLSELADNLKKIRDEAPDDMLVSYESRMAQITIQAHLDDISQTRTPTLASGLRSGSRITTRQTPIESERSRKIRETLTASGFKGGAVDDEFIKRQMRAGLAYFTQTEGYLSQEEAQRQSRQAIMDTLNKIKDALSQKTPDKTASQILEALSPAARERIKNLTPEELYERMRGGAVEFAEGIDERVRVFSFSDGLGNILTDGKYRTVHEGSNTYNAPALFRRDLEVQFGYALDTPSHLRPASGFILHHSKRERLEREAREAAGSRYGGEQGIDMDYLDVYGWGRRGEQLFAKGYGSHEIILKPDVSHRTQFGKGDSVASMFIPADVQDKDPDKLLTALTFSRNRAKSIREDGIAEFLEGSLTGQWEKVGDGKPHYGTLYFEALVGGSFDVSDIEEIRIDRTNFVQSVGKLSTAGAQDAGQFKKLVSAVQESITDDMIDSLNLSNAQKNNLKKLRDNLFSQQIRPGLNTSERDMEFVANRENVALDSLLEQIIRDEEVLRMKRKVDQLIDAARKNNFDGTIRLVGPDGVNVFNPKLRRGYVDGDSIEDVITRRLTERLTELGELLTIRRRERKPLPLPAT